MIRQDYAEYSLAHDPGCDAKAARTFDSSIFIVLFGLAVTTSRSASSPFSPFVPGHCTQRALPFTSATQGQPFSLEAQLHNTDKLGNPTSRRKNRVQLRLSIPNSSRCAKALSSNMDSPKEAEAKADELPSYDDIDDNSLGRMLSGPGIVSEVEFRRQEIVRSAIENHIQPVLRRQARYGIAKSTTVLQPCGPSDATSAYEKRDYGKYAGIRFARQAC